MPYLPTWVSKEPGALTLDGSEAMNSRPQTALCLGALAQDRKVVVSRVSGAQTPAVPVNRLEEALLHNRSLG